MEYKGGDQKMKENDMKEGYDYTAECIDKLDQMIENPKMATPEALMEIRDKLANEGEMESEEEPMKEDMKDEGKPSLVIAIGKGLRKGMKALILTATFVGICTSFCIAERKFTRKDFDKVSISNQNYLYYSTATLSSLTANQVNFTTNIVCASTYPVIIHTINVETAGTDSFLEVFNSRVSTFSTGIHGFNIDTTASKSLLYDVYFDSGMAINNRGTTAAKITITYKER